MAVPTELLTSELDHLIQMHTREGWEIVNRTTTTAQLRRRKRWSFFGTFVFVLLPLIGGFLFDACFYGIAAGGFILVLLGYILAKDDLKYISETDLINRLLVKKSP